MKRVNGFLDLDQYYEEIKKKHNYDQWDLICEEYIIESLYALNQFWVKINDEYYYFKTTKDIYEELIVSECAKFLGIKAVEYDLAVFMGKEGVISKSYQRDDCEYVAGDDILYDYLMDDTNLDYLEKMGYNMKQLDHFYLKNDIVDSMHTFEIIWQAIEYRYKNKRIPINIAKIMNGLVSMFYLNVLMGQNDGMAQNWELEETRDEVTLKPFYDGSDTLNDAETFPSPSMSMASSFKNKEGNNYLKLEEFFRISSQEFNEMFIGLFDKLDVYNFINILNKVEKKIERPIPQFTR